MLTIVQAVGAMELARKGALVTRLDSIEDAASIDVLCLDKTGTMTQNRLSVTESRPLLGYKEEDVITTAVIEYAKGMDVDFNAYAQVSYAPFNPSIKRTEAIIETNGSQFRVVKGAAQVVMSLCRKIDKETIKEVNRTIEEFSKRGYRTIAVAQSEGDDLNNLKLMGLLPLSDPPRPDCKIMIEEAGRFGVRPMMLTGDNIAIAKEIAHQVGIGDTDCPACGY